MVFGKKIGGVLVMSTWCLGHVSAVSQSCFGVSVMFRRRFAHVVRRLCFRNVFSVLLFWWRIGSVFTVVR